MGERNGTERNGTERNGTERVSAWVRRHHAPLSLGASGASTYLAYARLALCSVPGWIVVLFVFGMTLLTHGLAEEVRDANIAVNSLWPVTIIESQASLNWGLGTRALWRKPAILVDCVLRMVQKEPSELTGRALLDEDFLRGEGVTDFSSYACVPGSQPPRIDWESKLPAV